MSSYLSSNFLYLLYFFNSLFYLFYLFFIINRYLGIKFNKKFDINKKQESHIDISIVFLKFFLLLTLIFIATTINSRLVSSNFFYNNLFTSTFNLNIIHVIFFILFLLICSIYLNTYNSLDLTTDYVFSIMVVFWLSPLIYYSPNLFSMFFVLELLSCAVLYNFTTSKTQRSNNYLLNANSIVSNRTSKEHVKSLFIQFWISFFSSILILLFLILSLFSWGTCQFSDLSFFMDYIFSYHTSNYLSNLTHHTIWYLFFIIGFFLKSGLVPFHIYKVEVYKGLSLPSIVFYSFIFFLSYFTYISFLNSTLLNKVTSQSYNLILIILFLSSPIVLHSALNVKQVKTFFAYSGIINSYLLALPLFTLS